jgi:asparagine synthase (glutamine-hydrolysing)
MQLADVSWYLPDDILVKVDRATMAVGLEAREPLLDHRLFAYATQLPTSTLISRELGGKHILKDILSSYVPATMFDRPKAGFSLPIADWLRGGLREWASEFLTTRHMDDIGIKDSTQIMSIWQQHLRGDIDAQDTLWPVLSLLSWKHQRI